MKSGQSAQDKVPPEIDRPYELEWAGRNTELNQLEGFERLRGWQVSASKEVEAQFERVSTPVLFGEYAGAVRFSSRRSGGSLTLVPPVPLEIADPVDRITCWGRLEAGAGWDREEGPEVSILLMERDGRTREVALGRLRPGGWQLLSQQLPPELWDTTVFPLFVSGVRLSALPQTQQATVWLDSLRVFLDARTALSPDKRPRRAVLAPGQLPGVHTGEGELPFPVDAYTVLPKGAVPQQITVQAEADGRYRLRTESSDFQYRVHTQNGIAPVEVLNAQEKVVARWDTLALRVPDVPHEAGWGTPVARVERDGLFLEYAGGMAFRIFPHASSLVIEVSVRGGPYETLEVGAFSFIDTFPDADLSICAPFLPCGAGGSSPLFVGRDGTTPLFALYHADPYRSNASVWQYEKTNDTSSWQAHYFPVWRGRRNDIHERIILTVAEQLDSVWPRIPNPQSLHAHHLHAYILDRFSGRETEKNYASIQARIAQWRVDGLTHLLTLLPDQVWRQGRESRSFRLDANPYKGGNEALADLVTYGHAMGWKPALAFQPREISPLNAYWSDDRVIRDRDGNWRTADDGFSFRPRAPVATRWHAKQLDELRRRYPAPAYWWDHFTAAPPWAFTDYDGRMPGAGTFSQVLHSDGELARLWSRRTGVPLLTTGVQTAWLMAGLVDGLVMTEADTRDLTAAPYFPVFKLRRLQPQAVFFGVGARRETDLDAVLAAQLAYGQAGELWPAPHAETMAWRSYFMMRVLQERYLGQIPDRILYWNGAAYVDAETALASGVWRVSRLYLAYPGDLEIWVNGSEHETWEVRVGERRYLLPAHGWLAIAPEVLVFSGLHEGHRVDYVESPAYRFVDGRGRSLPDDFRPGMTGP